MEVIAHIFLRQKTVSVLTIPTDEELQKTYIIFTLENQRRRYLPLKSKTVNVWDKENSS